MLAELLGLKPKNDIESGLLYASKLITMDSLADRFFPTRREELEEELLKKQIAAMGPNPNDDSLDKSLKYGTAAIRASRNGEGFLKELLNPQFKKYHYIETVTPDLASILGGKHVLTLRKANKASGFVARTLGKAI